MDWPKRKDDLGKEIVTELFNKGMIKTWYRNDPKGWFLKSRIWSPFYIQLRMLPSYPRTLKKVGDALGKLIKEECKNVNRIIGVAMAGVPIALAISLQHDIPSCFTRKLENVGTLEEFNIFIKKYGEHSIIEGRLEDDDVIAIVDDLVTKFDSKLITIAQLEQEVKVRKLKGVRWPELIVLLDREQGAVNIARKKDINLHCLIPFKSKGLNWLKDVLHDQEYEIIKEYLGNPGKFQDQDLQKELFKIVI